MKFKQVLLSLKPYFKIPYEDLVWESNGIVKDLKLRNLIHKFFKCKSKNTFEYWYYHHKDKDFESKVTCPMCNNVVDVERKYCCDRCRRSDPNYKVLYRNNWYKKYSTNLEAIRRTGTLFGGSKHKKAMKAKYGVEQPMHSEYIKRRLRRNVKRKYGCDTTFQIESVKEKSRQTCLDRYGVDNFAKTDSFKSMFTPEFNRQRADKYYEVMKATKGFKGGTSKEEKQILKYIRKNFKVESPYRSKLYPFNCDFYLVDYKIYIEYQGFFTHGSEPYDARKKAHRQLVKELKSKKGWQYEDTLKVWGGYDPLKRKTAKQNNLRWFEFFDYDRCLRFVGLLYDYVSTHKRVDKRVLNRLYGLSESKTLT